MEPTASEDQSVEPYNSYWVSSVVMALALALVQCQRIVAIPARHWPKLRMGASGLVLLASAYSLFDEHLKQVTSGKIHAALLVLGFISHYLLSLTNGTNGNSTSNGMEERDSALPLAQALFKYPQSDRKSANARRQKIDVDNIPEGWSMQVDGGEHLQGRQRRSKGRRSSRKDRPGNYVLEQLGSWDSAEELLQGLRRTKGARQNHKKMYETGYDPAERVNVGRTFSMTPKKTPFPPELRPPARARPQDRQSKNPDNHADGKPAGPSLGGKSLAVVQNVSGAGAPSVFHINPLDENQIRLANRPSATGTYVKSGAPFKIKPLNVPGVEVVEEPTQSIRYGRSVEQKGMDSVTQKPTLSQRMFTSNLNTRPFTDERSRHR